jgi:hypothetical protein
MWPSGSAKHAVRIGQGRFIGPFSNSTPRSASSAQTASASSTQMLNWKREPASWVATVAGAISAGASTR